MTNQEFTHIGFDLDGTLLTSEKCIKAFTRDVLTRVHKSGKHLIVLSGRHTDDTFELLQREGVLSLFEWIITADGCHICKNGSVERYELPMLHLFDAFRMAKIAKSKEFVDYVTPYGDILLYPSSNLRTLRSLYRHIKRNRLLKSSIFRGEKVIIENGLNPEQEGAISSRYTVHGFAGGRYEIMHQSSHKYAALRKLQELGVLSLDQFLYFGDDANDKECFVNLPHVCVMGSAPQELRNYSKLDEIGNCDEDGVAKALKCIFELK